MERKRGGERDSTRSRRGDGVRKGQKELLPLLVHDCIPLW